MMLDIVEALGGKSFSIIRFIRQFVLTFYISFVWLYYFLENDIFLYLLIFIGLIGFLYVREISLKVKVAIGVIVLGAVINVFITTNGIGGSLVLFVSFVMSIMMIKNLRLLYFIAFISFVVICAYLCYKMFYIGYAPGEILDYSGRNRVGMLLLSSGIFFSALNFILYRKYDIIVPSVVFVLSVFLIGRSTVIVSLFYSMITLYFVYIGMRGFKGVIFVSFVGLLLFFLYDNYFQEIYYSSRLYERGFDTPRYAIWNELFGGLRFDQLMLGYDYEDYAILSFWGQPHNAFLKFHSRIGVFVLSFFYIVYLSIKNYMRRKEYYLLMLLVLLMIRMFFDSEYLIGPIDYVLFFLILYPILNPLGSYSPSLATNQKLFSKEKNYPAAYGGDSLFF